MKGQCLVCEVSRESSGKGTSKSYIAKLIDSVRRALSIQLSENDEECKADQINRSMKHKLQQAKTRLSMSKTPGSIISMLRRTNASTEIKAKEEELEVTLMGKRRREMR